ncbi:MAG: hypothetical protein M1813_008829 [Trichoglossum hirsutum]|nr:MAG: hypothetical protein M1813_008829 [Trichoglossum hirsutum]
MQRSLISFIIRLATAFTECLRAKCALPSYTPEQAHQALAPYLLHVPPVSPKHLATSLAIQSKLEPDTAVAGMLLYWEVVLLIDALWTVETRLTPAGGLIERDRATPARNLVGIIRGETPNSLLEAMLPPDSYPTGRKTPGRPHATFPLSASVPEGVETKRIIAEAIATQEAAAELSFRSLIF